APVAGGSLEGAFTRSPHGRSERWHTRCQQPRNRWAESRSASCLHQPTFAAPVIAYSTPLSGMAKGAYPSRRNARVVVSACGDGPARKGGRMHTRKAMCWQLFSIISVAAFAVVPAKALDSAAEFYRGKQITVIVGSSAGGGYDIYARLLA